MLAVLAAASALPMVEPAQAQSFNCNFAKRSSEVALSARARP